MGRTGGARVIETLLVGYGRFGRVYARRISEHRTLNLGGVVEVGDQLGTVRDDGLRAFGSLSEAIDTIHPRLVIVATPPEEHARMGLYALQRHCHVMLAKPGALGIDQAERLTTTAWERHRSLYVDYTPTMSPAWREVCSQATGREILTMRLVRRGTHKPQECGALWDLAPHDVALALDIAPDDPARHVWSRGWWTTHHDELMGAWVHIEHESGRTTRIEVDWLAPITERRVEIVQPDRIIVWDQLDDTVGVDDAPDPKMIPVNTPTDNVTRTLDRIARTISLPTADDSHRLLRVTRILEQAERSMYEMNE